MSYRISPHAYGKMFAIPCDVVQKHIKLAGSAQLKVLLWLFSQGGTPCDAEEIAQGIGLKRADVVDAMQYWLENGLITEGAFPEPAPQPAAPEPKAEQANTPDGKNLSLPHTPGPVVPPPIGKPTREEVAKRGEQSPEIAWMLKEAQQRLGRTISVSEMSTLVWLHDSEGLPPAVILMIMGYSLSQGKCNMRYIERVAINWAQEEIDTVEKAEKKLYLLEQQRQAWSKVQSAFALERRSPSAKEEAMAAKWVNEWNFSPAMLRLAYDSCVDATGKFSMAYINKILEKWVKTGVRTPEEAAGKGPSKGKTPQKRSASYSLDQVEQMLLNS